MMRKMYQDGPLYKLDSDVKIDQSIQKSSQLESFENNYTQEDLQSIRKKQQERKLRQMQQNVMAMIFGGIFCLVTTLGGLYLVYYVFGGILSNYIPFLKIFGTSELFLTESNAQQYFQKNPVYAGEIHYSRIPFEYWQHRIQMVKSMGLNSLSVYVFWNYHEIQKGKFDFETENKNLTKFFELAKKHDMRILIRPGPYVCAQWDFGGLPARLLAIKSLQIRSSNDLFIAQTQVYFNELIKILRPFIQTQQNPTGPIIMIQVENEPGWFTNQTKYIERLKQLWDKINPGCSLYYDDNKVYLESNKMYWNNAIIGINSQIYRKSNFKSLQAEHAVIAGEVYSGWFTPWGSQTYQSSSSLKYDIEFLHQFGDLLSENKSFSMYMAHGGTNFGLTAGYNLITSYDYFSPINEQGSPTSKFHYFRSIYANYTKNSLTTIPQPIPSMKLNFGVAKPISSLSNNMGQALVFTNKQTKPLIFESQELKMFNQGLVLYEVLLQGPKKYQFQTIIHDFGIVYLDGNFLKTIKRSSNAKKTNVHLLVINCKHPKCRLQILIQALGHVNFGSEMKQDFKGLIQLKLKNSEGNTLLLEKDQWKWKYYKFYIKNQPEWVMNGNCDSFPCLYHLQTDLNETKDTYLNFNNFKKGIVWVNGHNLGRYWDIGPQKKLYCPGVWLKKGKNKIVILQFLHSDNEQHIKLQVRGDKTLYDKAIN